MSHPKSNCQLGFFPNWSNQDWLIFELVENRTGQSIVGQNLNWWKIGYLYERPKSVDQYRLLP